MKPCLVALLCAVCLLGMTNAQAQDKRINVVVTTGMIGDIVEHVGGECVNVTAIMGPGVDPHLYQASANDVGLLRQADIIFYSGYSLEGQLGEVLERFAEVTPTLAVAPAAIDPAQLISVQDVYGIDPHVWMDVSLWARVIPTVAQALAELSPDCTQAMQHNANAYEIELMALHDWVEEAIASIPEQQRILVTAHDAFNYYGRAYAIEVAGIQGISTETESGVADIRAMARVVKDRQVPAVFVESTINPRMVQAVIDSARQQGQDVSIGGELYSDAMGEKGKIGGTYIGMLYENTRHIVEALGGELPALPSTLAPWAERWNVSKG